MTKARITKKLVAFATTMMMMLAMVLPVSAADGSITVHKLGGADATSAFPNQTGEQVPQAQLPTGFTPLNGAGFTLYRVDQAGLDAMVATLSASKGIASSAANPDGSARFTFTDGSPTTTIAGTQVATGVTAGVGEYVFGGLADGYYVLVETDTPQDFIATTPSLIRLPMTNQDGTANRNVHVYPKNVSNVDGIANKLLNGNVQPVTNGQTVRFDLTGKFLNDTLVNSVNDLRLTPDASANAADYGTASITDIFSASFTLRPGTEEVYLMDIHGARIGGQLVNGTDYVLSGNRTATLTPAGIDKAIVASATGWMLSLEATYVGGPSTVIGSEPNVATNEMSALIEAPAEVGTGTPEEDEVNAPSISIVIHKTSSDTTIGNLAGVKFHLATVANPTTAADFVTDINGVRLEATTDAEGRAVFSNLDDYGDTTGKTYYIVEVETVSGHQLAAYPTQVTFNTKANYQSSNPNWFDAAGNWAANVNVLENVSITNYKLGEQNPNEPGFSLPLTGGAGTLAFTAIGILVMLGATVVYLNGKKKNV